MPSISTSSKRFIRVAKTTRKLPYVHIRQVNEPLTRFIESFMEQNNDFKEIPQEKKLY